MGIDAKSKVIPIRHTKSRNRLCDFEVTNNNRIMLVDVERDRFGNKETYREDITDYVLKMSKMITKQGLLQVGA